MPQQADETELRFHEALTCATAAVFCAAVQEALTAGTRQLWLNLEGVKAVDAVGLSALRQAVRAASLRGLICRVLPSAIVYRALLNASILEDLQLEGPGAGPASPLATDVGLDEAATPLVAASSRLGLRPPAWGELRVFERWANEPLLDQMVGSQLLYLCRHMGPYHPDFVTRVLHDPTSITLLIQPLDAATEPVGFVRVYGVHLAERFAFLETALGHARSLRAGWGIEASRLTLAYAMDTLELHRVEAKVYAYNVLSINSLRRNGFQQEGVLREARTYEGQRWDLLVFGILEAEMRAQRAREAFPYMGFWPSDARP